MVEHIKLMQMFCSTFAYIRSHTFLKCAHDIFLTGFWPDCQAPPSCSDLGMTGIYPNCVKTPPTCPQYRKIIRSCDNKIGISNICKQIEIRFISERRNADGECVRIECPPGHEGDYQPHCKLVPKCPPEYPGTSHIQISYEKKTKQIRCKPLSKTK